MPCASPVNGSSVNEILLGFAEMIAGQLLILVQRGGSSPPFTAVSDTVNFSNLFFFLNFIYLGIILSFHKTKTKRVEIPGGGSFLFTVVSGGDISSRWLPFSFVNIQIGYLLAVTFFQSANHETVTKHGRYYSFYMWLFPLANRRLGNCGFTMLVEYSISKGSLGHERGMEIWCERSCFENH